MLVQHSLYLNRLKCCQQQTSERRISEPTQLPAPLFVNSQLLQKNVCGDPDAEVAWPISLEAQQGQ